MAAPTPPTRSEIVAEGLNKGGESDPAAALTARAEGHWMEEIKADIWKEPRRLKSLQTKAVQVLTKGQGQYNNQTDFWADMTMQFATGSRYGVAQGGAVGYVDFAASDAAQEGDVVGREVVIYSGTGIGSISQITAYNSTTKRATVSPDFATAPAASSGYLVLDSYDPVDQKDMGFLKQKDNPVSPGYPCEFFPFGNNADGGYVLWPVPWRTDSQPMILIQRYFLDLSEADLSGTLMLKLYQKWRNLWVIGIKWKTLEDGDDERANGARTEYRAELRKLLAAEDYENTLRSNRVMVQDY